MITYVVKLLWFSSAAVNGENYSSRGEAKGTTCSSEGSFLRVVVVYTWLQHGNGISDAGRKKKQTAFLLEPDLLEWNFYIIIAERWGFWYKEEKGNATLNMKENSLFTEQKETSINKIKEVNLMLDACS